jgi:hypothetical protein
MLYWAGYIREIFPKHVGIQYVKRIQNRIGVKLKNLESICAITIPITLGHGPLSKTICFSPFGIQG